MKALFVILISTILTVFCQDAFSQDNNMAGVYKLQQGVFISMNAVDLLTTIQGLEHGAMEKNPLFRHNNHPLLLSGVKLLYVSAALYSLDRIIDKHPILTNITLFILNSFFTFAVINNTGWLARH